VVFQPVFWWYISNQYFGGILSNQYLFKISVLLVFFPNQCLGGIFSNQYLGGTCIFSNQYFGRFFPIIILVELFQ
jgi:hypothetical protein